MHEMSTALYGVRLNINRELILERDL